MRNTKQRNIKNQTYYFFNDMINTKAEQKSHIKTLIFITLDTQQIKKFDNYENIHSANPLYLATGEAHGYIEEINGNKYLTFASADKNKELLKKYAKLCMKINI